MLQSETLKAFLNVSMQIAIPLAVCSVILILIMVLRKYFKIEAVAITAVVIGLTTILGINGVNQYSEKLSSIESNHDAVLSSEQKDNNHIIAATLIKEGYIDSVKSILDPIYLHGNDDSTSTLLSAWFHVKKGDYRTALALYEKASDEGENCSDELKLTQKIVNTDKFGNKSTLLYLSKEGLDPNDYNIKEYETDKDGKLRNDLTKLVNKRLDSFLSKYSKSESSEPTVKAAKNASSIVKAFNDYSNDKEIDTENIQNLLKRVTNSFKKSESLERNSYIRLAVIKGNILLGEWDSIGKILDDNSSEEELIVATELHRLGLLKENDFSKEFLNKKTPHLNEVTAVCRQILDKKLSNEDRKVRKAYEEKLEYLESFGQESAMNTLISRLGEKASDGSSGELTSKTYLEMAKAVQSLGDNKLADMYIDKAFGTVSYCTDDGYTVPMTELLGIINGNSEGGSDDIKNVSSYVNNALENSLPENISASTLNSALSSQDGQSDSTNSTDISDFGDHMSDTVVQMTAVLNIGAIDVSSFPDITARIQVNSPTTTDPDEIRELLNVIDCGSEITDFKIEKKDVSTSRIIMLCDVSGSMYENVASLRNAISKFADNLTGNEEVYIIGFDDSVSFQSGRFLNNPDDIAEYANKMGAYGGTDMYNPLKMALELFPDDVNANNVIILMTDGEDNYPQTEENIRYEITPLAERNNVTVYTLGLGSSVNTAYLETIADAGNGSFLYVDSDERLENFYDFIHNQLANQYYLTYTAKNTTLNSRVLKISLDNCVGTATKNYYLVKPDHSFESADAYYPYTVQDEELAVFGLTTKLLYMSTADQKVKLRGNGFDAGDTMTVRMSDNVEYTLAAQVIDAGTIELTIPSNTATGVYTIEIAIRDSAFKLNNELTIAVQGKTRSFVYGDYEFTSFNATKKSDGSTVLSGNVTMNGWLHFKGDLEIVSDYQHSERVYIKDNSGAYIQYTDNGKLSALAKYLAEKGVPVELPAFGEFYISNEEYSPNEYADFYADKIDISSFSINILMLQIDNFSMQLYPDVIRLNGIDLSYSLPFQKEILKNFPTNSALLKKFPKIVKTKSLLEEEFGAELRGLLGATDIGIQGSISYESLYEDDDSRGVINMVSLPLRLEKFEVAVDTLSNNYDLEAQVKFVSFKDMVDTLALKFGIKGGMFDSLEFGLDGEYSIDLIATPIPISISEFGLKLSNLSQFFDPYDKSSTIMKILNIPIQFKFKTNIGDVTSKLPHLKKFFGKDTVVLASLDDCTISCTLKEFRFKFDCDIKLFDKFNIGHAEINAGTFPYKNTLLGINTNKQYGLNANVTVGADEWKASQCTLTLKASGDLCIGYPVFLSAQLGGEFGFDVGWWIFSVDFDVKGDIGIGFFINSNDEFQFTLAARGAKNGAYSGFNLSFSPSTKMDIYTY